MKDLPSWLWPIVILIPLGGFIDFLIGSVGQNRARGLLETWWIKFDDVRWNNFGRKEALFAVNLLCRWSGRRFFSMRRWVFVILYFTMSLIFGHFIAILRSARGLALPITIIPAQFVTIPLSAIGLATSLSLTRLIAVTVARLSDDGKGRNFVTFTIFFIITYFLLALWLPVMHLFTIVLQAIVTFKPSFNKAVEFAHQIVGNTIMQPGFYLVSPMSILDEFVHGISILGNTQKLQERLFEIFAINFAQICAAYIAHLVRLIIAIVFVGSFILRPILMTPISLIWQRIVESDKPLFTLILGGSAALIGLVNELVKHIS